MSRALGIELEKDREYWVRVEDKKNELIDDAADLQDYLWHADVWGDLQDWLKGDDDAAHKFKQRLLAYIEAEARELVRPVTESDV